MRVIWAGSSKITPMDRVETIALAVKQHFSMARTREYFPGPPVKAHRGLQGVAHAVEQGLDEAVHIHEDAVDGYRALTAKAQQHHIHDDGGDPSGNVV